MRGCLIYSTQLNPNQKGVCFYWLTGFNHVVWNGESVVRIIKWCVNLYFSRSSTTCKCSSRHILLVCCFVSYSYKEVNASKQFISIGGIEKPVLLTLQLLSSSARCYIRRMHARSASPTTVATWSTPRSTMIVIITTTTNLCARDKKTWSIRL